MKFRKRRKQEPRSGISRTVFLAIMTIAMVVLIKNPFPFFSSAHKDYTVIPITLKDHPVLVTKTSRERSSLQFTSLEYPQIQFSANNLDVGPAAPNQLLQYLRPNQPVLVTVLRSDLNAALTEDNPLITNYSPKQLKTYSLTTNGEHYLNIITHQNQRVQFLQEITKIAYGIGFAFFYILLAISMVNTFFFNEPHHQEKTQNANSPSSPE